MDIPFESLIDGINFNDLDTMEQDFYSEQNPDTVALEELDIKEDISMYSDKIIYPSIVLSGPLYESEFDFLYNLKYKDEERLIPLYVSTNGVIKKLCNFELTFNNLLLLSRFKGYSLMLKIDETKERLIDLNDPNCLMKYISF